MCDPLQKEIDELSVSHCTLSTFVDEIYKLMKTQGNILAIHSEKGEVQTELIGKILEELELISKFRKECIAGMKLIRDMQHDMESRVAGLAVRISGLEPKENQNADQ